MINFDEVRFSKEELEKMNEDFLLIVPNWKENPNGFPIIKKWNLKQYREHKFELFHFFEKSMEEYTRRILEEKTID